jgi:hypothetical protein
MTKRWILGLGAAFLLAGFVWWFWGGDNDLARLQAIRSQLDDQSLSEHERQELRRQFREGLRALPEGDRQRLFAEGFRGRMNRNPDEFFALGPKERVAYLDRQINEMEKRRRDFAGRAAPQRPPGGGFDGGGPNRSPAEREQARKARLDFSSAEERAKRAAYLEQLNQRRAQRGLDSVGGWR